MAKWSIPADPSTMKETKKSGNKFPPVPRGIYTIQVADFKDGISQATRRPMITLMCEVAEPAEYCGQGRVYVNITQIPKGAKGHGIMLRNLHAFGVECGDTLTFDTSDLQGAKARALLGVEPSIKVVGDKTYTNERNFIEELYTSNHPEPLELPPAPVRIPAVPKASLPASPAGQKRQDEIPF